MKVDERIREIVRTAHERNRDRGAYGMLDYLLPALEELAAEWKREQPVGPSVAEVALKECARRILRWRDQHSQPDECAVLGLTQKMLIEVIAPVLAGGPPGGG